MRSIGAAMSIAVIIPAIPTRRHLLLRALTSVHLADGTQAGNA